MSGEMKRVLALVAVVVLLVRMVPMTVQAGHGDGTGTVSATVTAAFLSVSVTGQQLAYGTLDLGDVDKKPTGQTDETDPNAAFKVTNNGTKTANWAIVGGASGDWAIGSSAGDDIYAHFWDDAADGTGNVASATSLHTSASASSLAANVTAGSDVFVWLQLDMPTDTNFTDQQSLPINIIATLP